MTQMKYAVAAGLIAILLAALVAATAAGPISPPDRSLHNPVVCYWRIHPHSHETGNLPAALAEARHGLWLATQLRCGSDPLIQSANRLSQLLVSSLQ